MHDPQTYWLVAERCKALVTRSIKRTDESLREAGLADEEAATEEGYRKALGEIETWCNRQAEAVMDAEHADWQERHGEGGKDG